MYCPFLSVNSIGVTSAAFLLPAIYHCLDAITDSWSMRAEILVMWPACLLLARTRSPDVSTMSAIRRIIQLVCFLKQHFYQVLDSLVVRISACHVEGPGSIPGRGGRFFFFNNTDPAGEQAKWYLAPRGIEPVTFALLARRSNQLS